MKTALSALCVWGGTVACGSRDPVMDFLHLNSKIEIDPKLQPFVSEFVEECQKRDLGDHCRDQLAEMDYIKFSSEVPVMEGACGRIEGVPTRIIISPLVKEQVLRFMMFHELGHCLLGKEHDNSTIIMRDSYDDSSQIMTYGIDWKKAVKQLFGDAEEEI
jgi:hypothetical protein